MLYADVISFLQQVNIKKSKKLAKWLKLMAKIFLSSKRLAECQ